MLFHIEPSSAAPIYRQIAGQVREAVACGRLRRGDRLPSLRRVASDLVINHLTVKQAYDLLEREGVIETRRGRGTFVRPRAGGAAQRQVGDDLQKRMEELAAGARRAGMTRRQLEQLARRAWDELPPDTPDTPDTPETPAPRETPPPETPS